MLTFYLGALLPCVAEVGDRSCVEVHFLHLGVLDLALDRGGQQHVTWEV